MDKYGNNIKIGILMIILAMELRELLYGSYIYLHTDVPDKEVMVNWFIKGNYG